MRVKQLGVLAAALAMAVTLAIGAGAQTQRPNRQRQATQREARLSAAQVPVDLLKSVCKLTDEQATKIEAIQKKLAEDLRALRPQPGATPDPSAAQKRRELTQKATSEINDILTAEQKEALKAAVPQITALRAANVPLQVVGKLQLTEEQKQKMAEIAKELREKTANLPADERRAKMRELNAEARTKVEAILTPEQKDIIKKYNEENRARRQRTGGRRQTPPSSTP